MSVHFSVCVSVTFFLILMWLSGHIFWVTRCGAAAGTDMASMHFGPAVQELIYLISKVAKILGSRDTNTST